MQSFLCQRGRECRKLTRYCAPWHRRRASEWHWQQNHKCTSEENRKCTSEANHKCTSECSPSVIHNKQPLQFRFPIFETSASAARRYYWYGGLGCSQSRWVNRLFVLWDRHHQPQKLGPSLLGCNSGWNHCWNRGGSQGQAKRTVLLSEINENCHKPRMEIVSQSWKKWACGQNIWKLGPITSMTTLEDPHSSQ